MYCGLSELLPSDHETGTALFVHAADGSFEQLDLTIYVSK